MRRTAAVHPEPGPPCSTTAGLPFGVPARLPVDARTIAEIEQAVLVRLDRGKSAHHDGAAGTARCVCTTTDRRRPTSTPPIRASLSESTSTPPIRASLSETTRSL